MGDVEPSRFKIDFRSDVRKSEDLLGKSSQTMRENLNTFTSYPYIVGCSPMNNSNTETSLTNHPIFESNILIRCHPEDMYKTLVQIYDDKKPFDKKQEITLDFETYHAVVSLDRRSTEEQEQNRFVVVTLVKPDDSHKLVKLPFPGTTCN